MKKGKITITVTVGIACFCLMLVMFMQFKIVNETDITSIETMQKTELRTELANWKSKYEEAEQAYNETQSKIKEYKDTRQSNAETEQLMDSELEQTKLLLGETDVEGEGIEITLRDSDDESIDKINNTDLLLIVNSLKLSGAEAISINDHRIVNMSDIVNINISVTSFFIKVNGERILAPYYIKAIGDSKYLESGLIGNGGVVDTMKKIGQDVTIQPQTKIKIPKYEDQIKLKYIQ